MTTRKEAVKRLRATLLAKGINFDPQKLDVPKRGWTLEQIDARHATVRGIIAQLIERRVPSDTAQIIGNRVQGSSFEDAGFFHLPESGWQGISGSAAAYRIKRAIGKL